MQKIFERGGHRPPLDPPLSETLVTVLKVACVNQPPSKWVIYVQNDLSDAAILLTWSDNNCGP